MEDGVRFFSELRLNEFKIEDTKEIFWSEFIVCIIK